MIRLEGVNKYFNRYKRNQIHVINNTSLTLEGTGLVALLGPSGCGKTTLLNAIGGLDTVNSGDIYLDDERLTRRMTFKKDAVRNLKVGYIFQNYNLIDNLTVFENVALVLKMQGMKDEEEIREKVYYALEMVGMYRYRNRYADMLSGGERQRVGIARAIAKNPQIIIADEPTGNLDSKNTIEVMNIIKTISQNRLVILVTHEVKLAEFFASRIIQLKDGMVVSDEVNEHGNDLDYRIDNDIYLGDIPNQRVIEDAGYKLNIYDAGDSNITLDIVIKNGNIYLRTKDYLSRLEIVDENSSVELIEGKYEGIGQDEYLNHGFDMDRLKPKKAPKHSSILNMWTMLKKGFNQVLDYPILKKLLLVGFFISAMFIMYGVSSIAGVINVPDERFVTINKDYIIVKEKKPTVESFQEIEAMEGVAGVIPGSSVVNFQIPYKKFIQTNQASGRLSGSLSDAALLSNKDITAGKLPENEYELVVDKMTLINNIKLGNAKEAGYFDVADYIGSEITIKNMPTFKLVGITDKKAPNVYVNKDMFIRILSQNPSEAEMNGGSNAETQGSQMISTEMAGAKGELSLKSGRWAENDYEVTVNYSKREEYPLNKEIKTKVNGVKLKVVGYFTDAYDRDIKVVNSSTLKYNVITKTSDMVVMSSSSKVKDKSALLNNLQAQGKSAFISYDKEKADYKNQNRDNFKTALIMGGIILAISLIEIFLIIRASFLSRIKEIGVYRAIGVKKTDIYKMFLGEIIAITTISAIPGFAFMYYIISQLVKNVEVFQYSLFLNSMVALIALAIIYAGNIIFGLMPVWRVVSKTPAAILSRTDVN